LVGSITRAEGSEDEKGRTLKSPYFIDGVHCEGLTAINDSVWPYNEEMFSGIMESRNQNACESIFSIYGVTVYEWYTPEKLASIANHLKKNEDFSSAELSIKKSEMQNHVHLFLVVKPKNHGEKSIKIKSFSYAGNDHESERQTQIASFDWENKERNPVFTQAAGVQWAQSVAKNAPTLRESVISKNDQNVFLNLSSYKIVDGYFKFGSYTGGNIGIAMDFHLLSNDINSQGRSSVDSAYTIYLDRKATSLLGNSDWGLVLDQNHYMNFEVAENVENQKYGQSIRLGAFFKTQSGNKLGDYYALELLGLFSKDGNDKGFYRFIYDFRKVSPDLFVSQYFLNAELMSTEVSDIGIYRRFYVFRPQSHLEVGGTKYFNTSLGSTSLSIFGGADSFMVKQAEGFSDKYSYRRASSFAGIRGSIAMKEWNIEGQISFNNERLQ